MKVTTDSCLFGAIVAMEISSNNECNILDIGTGTGLLSLMVAQQNENTFIDAIEIDESAAKQAQENIIASPWSQKIKLIAGDILSFNPSKRYDVIISNPPFYEEQLASPNAGRRQAHHSSELTLQQLFWQAEKLLCADGKFFVMIPFYRSEQTILLAKQLHLHLKKQWLIKQTPKHNWFRNIFCFSRQESAATNPFELSIKDVDNNYSAAFTELLQPYYLKL